MGSNITVEFADVKQKLTLNLVKKFVIGVLGNINAVIVPAQSDLVEINQFVKDMYNDGKGNILSIFIESAGYFFAFGIRSNKDDKTYAKLILNRAYVNSESDKSSKIINDFIQRIKKAYNVVTPTYGRGDWDDLFCDPDRYHIPPDVNDINSNLKHVHWLNFYGKQISEKFKASSLSSVPFGRIEKLADGGILLIRGKVPSENSEHANTIRKHLFGGT